MWLGKIVYFVIPSPGRDRDELREESLIVPRPCAKKKEGFVASLGMTRVLECFSGGF